MSELFMIARVAGRTVAVAAGQVGSVVDVGDIVRVPRAPGAIRGLAALRSRVVTVIDPGVALGIADATDARRAIVSELDGHHYAVLVDAVDDVASFDRRPIAAGLVPAGGWAGIADGTIERDRDLVLIADLARLVPSVAAAA